MIVVPVLALCLVLHKGLSLYSCVCVCPPPKYRQHGWVFLGAPCLLIAVLAGFGLLPLLILLSPQLYGGPPHRLWKGANWVVSQWVLFSRHHAQDGGRPILALIRQSMRRIGSNLAQARSNLTGFDAIRLESEVARIHPKWGELDRIWPDLGQHWHNIDGLD